MAWIAPLIQVGASMAGQQASADAYNAQDAQARAALAAIKNIQLPDVEKQKLLLELPQLIGEYSPEAEQYFQQGPSAMENISVTPAFEEAQLGALQSLQERGEEGLTAAERAILNQIRRSSAQEEQARQGQILQEMAGRGIGGSGIELAARLGSSQAAADRASQEADREAAMIQERQLAALREAGALAGQVRAQDFGEQSDVARAKDVINQFNTANRQSLETRNVGNRNVAEQQNLANKQAIANQQVQLRNSQQQYNKELDQQRFANEMAKVGRQVPQMNTISGMEGDRAARTGQMYSQIGTGLGEAIAGGSKLFSTQAEKPSYTVAPEDDTLAAIKRGIASSKR